jgi:hypothetical protein
MKWDSKQRGKGGEKEEKRKKKGEIPKIFSPQLLAALSRSVSAEATAQSLQRLLSTQAMVALPPAVQNLGYAPDFQHQQPPLKLVHYWQLCCHYYQRAQKWNNAPVWGITWPLH